MTMTTNIPPPTEKPPSSTDESGIYRNKLDTEHVSDHTCISSDNEVVRITSVMVDGAYNRRFGRVIREEKKERADRRKRGEVHLPRFAFMDKPLGLEESGPTTFKVTFTNGHEKHSFRFITNNWSLIEKIARTRLARTIEDDKYYQKHGPWRMIDIDIVE